MNFKRRYFALTPFLFLFGKTEGSFPSTYRIVAAAVVGQSNEQGAGRMPDSRLAGEPLSDPIPPNGGGRSWWPYLAKRLREEKLISLRLRNTAVGSTSLCDSWVGRVRKWQKDMPFVRGSYCLSNGSIYKLQIPPGLVANSKIVPSEAISGQPLSDGCVWELIRTGSVELGVVNAASSPDLLDPNGYLKRVVSEVNGVNSDEKWVFLSIGQTDKTLRASRSDFACAIEQVANHVTGNGIKILVGFTCYGGTPGLDEWYLTQLIPGLEQAMKSLSGNPLVFRGANLREALGVLPLVDSDERPGLLIDRLHLNNAGYVAAATSWFDAIEKSRIIGRAR